MASDLKLPFVQEQADQSDDSRQNEPSGANASQQQTNRELKRKNASTSDFVCSNGASIIAVPTRILSAPASITRTASRASPIPLSLMMVIRSFGTSGASRSVVDKSIVNVFKSLLLPYVPH